ncbi:MAG: hypothetical protein QW823_00325 [Candidatus Caldarchaeum sp.]|uniref:Transcription elongation factor NusA n=1 Tax=Caldiarchaeum subterraneum TaxID=311458 RepID=A0A7C4E0Y9_CALS0
MPALEFPVCVFDLKTGVLCSKCEQKIREGELTPTDLEIMRFFLELEKKFPHISSLKYVRSLAADGYLFVFFERGFSSLPADVQTSLRNELGLRTGLRVKLMDISRDLNTFLQSLVAPARLLAINKVWLPDQTTEVKAVVDDERSVGAPPNVLSAIVQKVLNISVSFEFQRRTRLPPGRFGR